MMNEKEFLGYFSGLESSTLRFWIERGWIAPTRSREGFGFREIDVARVRLIYEFSTDLGLDDNALDVILPLLDQVHGLRHQLRCLADAVSRQPNDVRKRIAEQLKNSGQ